MATDPAMSADAISDVTFDVLNHDSRLIDVTPQSPCENGSMSRSVIFSTPAPIGMAPGSARFDKPPVAS